MLPSFARSLPLPVARATLRTTAATVPWRPVVLVAAFVTLNFAMLDHPGIRYLMVLPHDWSAFAELPVRLNQGTVYEPSYWFVWSPVAAWLLASVFIPLGYSWWLGLHLASVVLLRSWKLVALAVLSVPFWVDTIGGNTFVFVFVAGSLAIRGGRWGTWAYLALCCLMPRPIQLPLAIWLLWRRPDARVPFTVMVLITLGYASWSGMLGDWLRILTALGVTNSDHFANLSPTKLFGSAWLVVGVPLAVWLTARGRVGLAGLMLTPYALPGYLMVLLWDGWRTPNPSAIENASLASLPRIMSACIRATARI